MPVISTRYGRGMWLVKGPTALHSGASDSPGAALTSVGGVQTNYEGASQLILKLNYTLGTETALNVVVYFPRTAIGTETNREGPFTDAGAGLQLYDGGFTYRFPASAACDVPVDLRGKRFYHVFAADSGGAGGNGTFTLFAEAYQSD